MELHVAVLLFVCLAVPLRASDTAPRSPLVLEPYDFLFDSAVEAYYNGDWLSVILNMEKALKNKATVRKVKAQCRLSCANQTAFGEHVDGVGVPIPGAGSLEDLGFFQKILKRADCVNSCEMEKLGHPTMHQVTEEIQLEFNKRSPYNYLQVAYFKVGGLTVRLEVWSCIPLSLHCPTHERDASFIKWPSLRSPNEIRKKNKSQHFSFVQTRVGYCKHSNSLALPPPNPQDSHATS